MISIFRGAKGSKYLVQTLIKCQSSGMPPCFSVITNKKGSELHHDAQHSFHPKHKYPSILILYIAGNSISKKISMTRKYFLTFGIFILLFSCTQKGTIEPETVSTLDLNKYMGTWYEIARFQNPFEKDLVGVTATYGLQEDGKIRVLNAGWKETLDGDYDAAVGTAKQPNPAEPGKLKVSFFFIFYADYYVLEVDTVDYQYALVGSSDPNYLWILGRKPQMKPKIYDMLLKEAAKLGYDTTQFYKVPQPQL